MSTGIEGLTDWLANEEKRLTDLCAKYAVALEQAKGGLHEIQTARQRINNGETDDQPRVPAGGGE